MVGSGVGGSGCHGDDGVKDSQGDGLFLLEGGIPDPIGLALLSEALVEPGVRLRVGCFYGVRQTIQELGRCNSPPCMRNQFSRLEYLACRTPWP